METDERHAAADNEPQRTGGRSEPANASAEGRVTVGLISVFPRPTAHVGHTMRAKALFGGGDLHAVTGLGQHALRSRCPAFAKEGVGDPHVRETVGGRSPAGHLGELTGFVLFVSREITADSSAVRR